jgi:Do/DeqQ family serine protease
MLSRWLAAVAVLAVGFVAGTQVTGRLQSAEVETARAAPAPELTPAALNAGSAAQQPLANVALPDFTQIAARTAPVVVNISSVQVVRQRSPFARDPFFGRLFGDDELLPPTRGESAGSGVIVSPDGYVLTNNHVIGEQVRGAQQSITVILGDKRERPAKLIGVDPYTDLALLRINEKNLPSATWGDSGTLKVAEWVLAIGNPYQLGQTVTLGIVSGMNRTYDDVSAVVDYIQTDAAINPGNSGGALINRRGEIVGINTWIYSQSGGDQGIGFAIPSNIARRVTDELIKTGEVKRGSIGIMRLASITPELARDLTLRDTHGALVWTMSRSSSAWRAGMRPGDVVVSFNGKRVDEPAQLQRPLLEAPIGSIVTLGILREGQAHEIKVQVESQSATRRNVVE